MNKYILYARKSSESDDRQIQSIDSQVRHMKDIAESRGLSITQVITEAASAKTKGKRKGFNQMVSLIESGEADSILCWHADRLSRNAVDGALIIDLIDRGLLLKVTTPSQEFASEPMDKFFLLFQFGQAKVDNDNKGKNVKRGMGDKAKTGWYPAPAPIGYLNSPDLKIGQRIIRENEILFPYLKQAWREVIYNTPIFVAYEHSQASWKADNQSTKFVSRSVFYRMFHNPFYYGRYEYPKGSGLWFDGKHQPMITKEEFDHVQKLCGLSKPTRNVHDLPFKGLFRCKECECLITATVKHKYFKKEQRLKPHIYYHCTHKKGCHQPPITQSDFFGQLAELVESISVPKAFAVWAKKWNEYLDTQEVTIQKKDDSKLKEQISKLHNQLPELRKFLIKGTFTEEEYREEKHSLEDQIQTLEQKLIPTHHKPKDIVAEAEFASMAKERLLSGIIEKQRGVVLNLGSNFYLNDKKVSVQLTNTLLTFQKFHKRLHEQKEEFELSKYADVFLKRPDLKPLNPSWLPSKDSNLENLLQREA